MGWQGNVFQVLIVVSGPNFTGFFVYNGAPAKGSLVAAIVAPGTTSDPFGNAVNAVANFGHWNAAGTLLQHFGIDVNGFTYLVNNSGNTVILGQSTDGSELFYTSAGIGAGNLAASIAPVAGTDTAGNNYNAGISSYGGLNTAILNASALTMFAGITKRATFSTSHITVFNSSGATIYDIDLSRAAQFLYADTGSAVQGALVASESQNSGTDQFGNAYKAGITSYAGTGSSLLSSGLIQLASTTLQTAAAQLTVSGSAGTNTQLNITSGTGTEAGGAASTLILGDSGVGAALTVIDGHDGQTYGTERVIQRTTATQQFTLASAVAITGLSRTLGIGSYHVRLKVFWAPSGVIGSTHVHNFAFSGTATGNVNGQCWQAQAASAVQQGSLNASAGNNLTASLTSPTHVAFPGWTEMEADITVTVAGTLTHTITLTTAGDDVTTSAGTFWKIEPL